jgi:hypothetical protein
MGVDAFGCVEVWERVDPFWHFFALAGKTARDGFADSDLLLPSA